MKNFESFNNKECGDDKKTEKEIAEEERIISLRNNLLEDMDKRGGGYDDLYIVFQAKKYNIAAKFVEYVYRGIINSETIKDKGFMGSYMVHNPNLDKEPHKWSKYYGQDNK
jgi:hypothetical protein